MSKQGKTPLNAGPFGAWLTVAIEAIEGRSTADVPCGDCTACCQSSQFIHVEPDDVQALSSIPQELLFVAPEGKPGTMLMGYDEHGSCPMLIKRKCTIYAHRPATCKSYDCRIFPAAGVPKEHNENPQIAAQAERWQFEYPTAADHAKHLAVRAAAQFLQKHPELFTEGRPVNATQLAVSAIKTHQFFVNVEITDDGSGKTISEQEITDVIKALIRTAQ